MGQNHTLSPCPKAYRHDAQPGDVPKKAPTVDESSPLAFWKQFLVAQMTHNMDYLVAHSIKDFHAPGFAYICFQLAPHLTIRMYVTFPTDGFNTNVINIHDHLYDSQMLCLAGGFRNVVFREEENPDGRFNYYYLTSALHPDNETNQIQLQNRGRVDLRKVSCTDYGPGETHFQPHDEIHMVITNPKRLNAFMIWEYATTKWRSSIYSTKPLGSTLPTPGAYNRYTADEIKRIITSVVLEMTRADIFNQLGIE